MACEPLASHLHDMEERDADRTVSALVNRLLTEMGVD